MEPLSPDLRKALKAAHPGLTDSDLEEYERLTAMRFTIDPDKDRHAIEELDRARERLIAMRMPQFAEVERMVAFKARQASGSPAEPAVEIRVRRADDNSGP